MVLSANPTVLREKSYANYIAQASLKHVVFLPQPLDAETTDVHHHTWLGRLKYGARYNWCSLYAKGMNEGAVPITNDPAAALGTAPGTRRLGPLHPLRGHWDRATGGLSQTCLNVPIIPK